MIHVCEPSISELEKKYVNEALDNNWLSSTAPPVANFEAKFSEKFGYKHSVAVNSGGSALFLALHALGITEGDEVIVPTFTMVATAGAVTQCGAKPVFVDTKFGEFNMDPAKIREKITRRTKAIIPVHIYGHVCDMDPIMEIARDYGLKVVEDCAEAHGAKYKGKYVGSFGDAACFSFYANKLMTTGEGGMIVCNSDELAERLRHLRAYDFDDTRHFWHKHIAWNFRMSSLEAAFGLAQLERLEELIEKRRKNAAYYSERLKNVYDIQTYPELENEECVFWMYPILCRFQRVGERDDLMKFLAENGIETRTFFFPMHWQPIYMDDKEKYPHADVLGNHGLYLPSSSDISDEDKNYVIEKIKEYYT